MTVSLSYSGQCADELSVRSEGKGGADVVELGFYRCRKILW